MNILTQTYVSVTPSTLNGYFICDCMCVWAWVCADDCSAHLGLKRVSNPWSWSHWWLWAPNVGAGDELRSSAAAVCTRNTESSLHCHHFAPRKGLQLCARVGWSGWLTAGKEYSCYNEGMLLATILTRQWWCWEQNLCKESKLPTILI